jgi:hypothetical protein
MICLPEHNSFAEFEKALLTAITEGSEGFGFAWNEKCKLGKVPRAYEEKGAYESQNEEKGVYKNSKWGKRGPQTSK